ncbi:MAG: hypothetical protein V4805_18525 [Pseudomonadota bacterium]
MTTPNALFLIMLVSLKAGREQQFSDFATQNAPLLHTHHIELIKSIAINIKGQLAGANALPQPDFIHIYKVPSMPQFMAYTTDERYGAVSALRAESTSSVIGYFAGEQPLPEKFSSDSPPNERMYIVGLANFIDKNEQGLEDFNQQAIAEGLFHQHGMHVEYQLAPAKVAIVVGDAIATLPDRIQVFFVDRADNLKQYVSDPLYKKLAPLRDETLLKYDFFAGALVQG